MTGSIAALVVTVAFGVVLLRTAIVRSRTTALRLWGVAPPTKEIVYAADYRALPPIPAPDLVELVLPNEVARVLARRERVAVACSLSAVAWNGALLQTSLPALASLAVATAITTTLAAVFVVARCGGSWLLLGPFLMPLGAWWLGPLGIALALVGLVIHFLLVAVRNAWLGLEHEIETEDWRANANGWARSVLSWWGSPVGPDASSSDSGHGRGGSGDTSGG